MSRFKIVLAIGAMLMATLVVGGSTPVLADPTGTSFLWAADNFQGDSAEEVVPFGVSTETSSGITVDSSVSVSPSIPELFLIGGKEYIEFSLTTTDGGFLAETTSDPSTWIISGLNWGPGMPPGVATGLIFLSWDIDGTYVDLDGSGFGLPVVPNPGTLAGVTGAPAIPLDIAGDPVDFLPFDTFELAGTSMISILLALGVPALDALAVNSMHVGFEVMHVPEPATMALMGLGLCSTLLMRRRRL